MSAKNIKALNDNPTKSSPIQLIFRKNQLFQVLLEGQKPRSSLLDHFFSESLITVEITNSTLFVSEYWTRHLDFSRPLVQQYFQKVHSTDHECVVLRSSERVLACIAPQSQKIVWLGSEDIQLERYSCQKPLALEPNHPLFHPKNLERLGDQVFLAEGKERHLALVVRGLEVLAVLQPLERQIFWAGGQPIQLVHFPLHQSLPLEWQARLPLHLRSSFGHTILSSTQMAWLMHSSRVVQVFHPLESVMLLSSLASQLEVMETAQGFELPSHHPLELPHNQDMLKHNLTVVRTLPLEYALVEVSGALQALLSPSSKRYFYSALGIQTKICNLYHALGSVWQERILNEQPLWESSFVAQQTDSDHVTVILERETPREIIEPDQTVWLWNICPERRLEGLDITQGVTLAPKHPLLYKLNKVLLERYFLDVEPSGEMVALVYQNGQLVEVLPPTQRKLYWKGKREMQCEYLDPFQPVGEVLRLALEPQQHSEFQTLECGADESVLVWRGEKLLKVIPPLHRAMYLSHLELRFERIDTRAGHSIPKNHPLLHRHNVPTFKNLTAIQTDETHFAVVYRQGEIFEILAPLELRIYAAGLEVRADQHSVFASLPAFVQEKLEANPVLAHLFQKMDLPVGQVGVVSHLKRPIAFLQPASHSWFWSGLGNSGFTLEQYPLEQPIPKTVSQTLERNLGIAHSGMVCFELEPGQVGMLLEQGTLLEVLPAGAHFFWAFRSGLKCLPVDLRLQTLTLEGKSVLSKDKVALELGWVLHYRILDAVKTFEHLGNLTTLLEQESRLLLLQEISVLTLDEVLNEQKPLEGRILAQLQSRLEPLGIRLERFGVQQIQLPTEIRSILLELVQAEKQTQINTLRRRDETATNRSLFNTAKLMEENPTALRIRELEALERIAPSIGTLHVSGGLEGVLRELVGGSS